MTQGNFWDLNSGEDIHGQSGEFEVAGNFEPIPDNTQALAIIDEAKWDTTDDGARFVSLRWNIMAPDDYKHRKVFQKLWVDDFDPRAKKPEEKRDKARRMLAAIDKNAGGKLLKSNDAPDDEALTVALTRKPMIIRINQWKMKNDQGEDMVGNWIGAVSPKTTGTVQKQNPPANKVAANAQPKGGKVQSGRKAPVDDDIPF
jgi:hypothetical protein